MSTVCATDLCSPEQNSPNQRMGQLQALSRDIFILGHSQKEGQALLIQTPG